MIQIANLSYAIADKPILQNLDFSLAKNDFALIFGPNGAGKSTLLKLLAGMLTPKQGEIHIDRKNIRQQSKKELARQVAYLPQMDEFTLPLRVGDVLLASRYPYQSFLKRPVRQDYEIFEKTVERFSLGGFIDRNIQTLSGGERKKVLLAGAIIQDVPIILLDEPLNFLDPASAMQVLKMLVELHSQGKTILLVSHAIEYFFPLANKMLALKNGKIHYFGPKEYSTQLFFDIFGVTVKRVMVENKEILYVHE